MSSCEEATFYLKNCPGTKIDGDGDGIPWIADIYNFLREYHGLPTEPAS